MAQSKTIINMSVEIQCTSCRGQRVYSGYQEPRGTAVVCHTCKGKGKIMVPAFVGTVPRDDIEVVRVGGELIPYDEFIAQMESQDTN